jgi:polar amino acid transport system substrate-binding protein
MKDVKFGAQAGTTSLDFITNVIKPTTEPYVYDDNAGAKAALEAKQIDAVVVDLPTAFYIAAAELTDATVVGQFPASLSTTPDNFGFVFDLNNELVGCVNTALAALKDDGTLATIEKTWLSDKTNAPVFAAE